MNVISFVTLLLLLKNVNVASVKLYPLNEVCSCTSSRLVPSGFLANNTYTIFAELLFGILGPSSSLRHHTPFLTVVIL